MTPKKSPEKNGFLDEWQRGEVEWMDKLEDREPQRDEEDNEPHARLGRFWWERPDKKLETLEIRSFVKVYKVLSVIACFVLIAVLLVAVSYLPRFGSAYSPDVNEGAERYVEKGLQETGAVNFVAGMILDYRAFDTLGESCVLFTAVTCVLILLRDDRSPLRPYREQGSDALFDLTKDPILRRMVAVLLPMILLFGIYVLFNGHLSPGGGFSGGAILGAGLILHSLAYGFEKTGRFFTPRVFKAVTCCALSFYCLAKSYSFYTGANHLESGIPLGTPGAIFSAGLILPLNICVGMVVACTMYGFYALFRKGGI